MANRAFQIAARAAFGLEDWLLLIKDELLTNEFLELNCVEDVEEFVFRAYDRLRSLRETPAATKLYAPADALSQI